MSNRTSPHLLLFVLIVFTLGITEQDFKTTSISGFFIFASIAIFLRISDRNPLTRTSMMPCETQISSSSWDPRLGNRDSPYGKNNENEVVNFTVL
ncbi:uncharacterized protein LOC122195071 isoform X2 [Lactuca sativa]|uniref:uncharacterized protein LOC122195071 isoform X2 n=1 Tax=Lactuca sativa TaxID=4236 RepID=UPI000CAC2F32|nr:uncharacterized protein LOC122195071 isoform X2 [Lactuca sativa]